MMGTSLYERHTVLHWRVRPSKSIVTDSASLTEEDCLFCFSRGLRDSGLQPMACLVFRYRVDVAYDIR